MKKKFIIGTICCALALSLIGCGGKEEVAEVAEETVAEPVQEAEEPEVLEEEEEGFVEPEGQITSGMGAKDGNYLYYSVGYYGLMRRDLETGEETEVLDTRDGNEYTNGYSELSVYDGYLYCAWDKYLGSEDSIYEIYRFSLDDFSGEKIADGMNPIVANRNVYYWQEEWTDNTDVFAKETLYTYNIDTKEISKVGDFGAVAWGNVDGKAWQGIYDYFYLDGKIYVEIEYEELGEYDPSSGMYFAKEDPERGIVLYDLDGNVIDQSGFDIEYLSYFFDASKYGVENVFCKSEIVGGGKIVGGSVSDGMEQVYNYIDENGNIILLYRGPQAG